MKKVLCLLLLCIFMVINFSCHQPNIFATLEEADSLVYINPQKALGKLDSIEKVMDTTEVQNYVYLRCLRFMAEDKLSLKSALSSSGIFWWQADKVSKTISIDLTLIALDRW